MCSANMGGDGLCGKSVHCRGLAVLEQEKPWGCSDVPGLRTCTYFPVWVHEGGDMQLLLAKQMPNRWDAPANMQDPPPSGG